MDIMTHAKFHFNQLILTLIFGIRASEAPFGPGERLKRPGLIGSTLEIDAPNLSVRLRSNCSTLLTNILVDFSLLNKNKEVACRNNYIESTLLNTLTAALIKFYVLKTGNVIFNATTITHVAGQSSLHR